jgi:hypothetical protein
MRVTPAVLALALGAIVCALPVAARAHPPASAQSGVTDDRDAKFPMTAAEYRERMTRHIEKARARMEEHITAGQLPQDKADEIRARFRDAVVKINAKVDEVCADGTVTKDEADAVHELSRSLLHHHHEEGR